MENMRAIKKFAKLLLMLCLTFGLMQAVQAEVEAGTATVTVERFVLGKGFIVEPTVVEFSDGETYADLLQKVLAQNGLESIYSDHPEYGFYLEGIKNVDVGLDIPACVQRVLDGNGMVVGANDKAPHLEEFSYTNGSGWMYYVNDEYVELGLGRAYPKDNDVIRYMFTLCFGSDLTGISNEELAGGELVIYYEAADKTNLIRIMGKANEDRERWESVEEFEAAYAFAEEIMAAMDSSPMDVFEATMWLVEIGNQLPQDPTGIALNESQVTLSMDDKTFQLTHTLTPHDAVTEVSWKSDNTGIAAVNSQGLVTTVAEGETDIHAETENGFKASCHVVVTASLRNEFLAGKPDVNAKAEAYNSVTISWSAYKNATSYVVYQRQPGSSTWNQLAEVTDTSYTYKKAEPGISYYYTVRAASTKWDGTDYSGYGNDIAVKTTIGKTTLSKVASAAYNKITLTWKKTDGASGYRVYRATSKSGTYKEIKQLSSGSTVSWSDNDGLTAGKTYYYKVRAYRTVDGEEVYGDYSDIKSAKPVPSKATLSKASSSAYNKIKVTWKKVTGASGYRVYRSTSKNGTYKYVKQLSKGSTVSYTDKGLTAGKTYYYKVRAYRTVSGAQVYGEYSGIKSAKPVPVKAKISKLTTAKNKATVKWSKVSGASGYEVYYAMSKNGKYKRAKRLTKGSAVSFTHSKLKTGKTYYYKVRAYRTVNGKRVYGAYSAVKGKKVK